MTKEKYAEKLDRNLTDLVERLHRMAYIPQPVSRLLRLTAFILLFNHGEVDQKVVSVEDIVLATK